MSSGVPRRNLKRREHLEGAHHPRAEADLARLAGRRIGLGEQRRRQMEFEAEVVAAELVRHLLEEIAVGVEPRHLVFVLVGHQLEQIARDRFGEPALAGRLFGFGGLHLVDQRAVAPRVAPALIGGEEGHAPLHHLLERLRQGAVLVAVFGLGPRQRLDCVAVERGAAAPMERRRDSSAPPRRSARSPARWRRPKAAARQADRRSRP